MGFYTHKTVPYYWKEALVHSTGTEAGRDVPLLIMSE